MWLKPTKQLRYFCHILKNLFNEANYLVRQALFNEKKWIQKSQLQQELSTSPNFQELSVPTAQKVLQLVDKAWKSFFAALADWQLHPEKYFQKPRIPKYKPKNGEFQLAFTRNQLIFSNNVLILPQQTGVQVKPRFSSATSLIGVHIIPRRVGYVLGIIYMKKIPRLPKNAPLKVVGIDIGLTNLITMANNIGKKPIAIKGGVVKSISQYYNKERAQIQSIYDHQGIKTGKTMQKLTNKRNKKMNDYFHKTSRKIIEYCVINDIGTIVIGCNPDWKQHCQIGKRNTQNFVTIPYYKLIQQLEYKATEQGITVIKQEESYSSKCSFLDDEPIEHHNNYLGRRITRGLFKSQKGTIINADMNCAYNILKKAFLNAVEADRIEAVGLHPTRWRLAAVTS
ncbi:MAG: RNA-guided endonuclease InsQ/TnpB family protein [Candidatus Hodarchaeales archaeon]